MVDIYRHSRLAQRRSPLVLLVVAFAVLWPAVRGSDAGPPEPEPDTEPSFGSETAIPSIQLPVRVPFSVPLPAASGGNGELSYSLDPIPPGLTFDTDSRVLSGAPTTVKGMIAVASEVSISQIAVEIA